MAVEFNEPQRTSNRPSNRKNSFFTGLIIKLGLAKTDKGAQVVMLAIAILALVITFMIFPMVTKKTPVPVVDKTIAL